MSRHAAIISLYFAILQTYHCEAATNSRFTCQSRFLSSDAISNRCSNKIASPPLASSATTVSSCDPRYDDLRRHSNNLRYNSNAAFIVLPRQADDVISILRYALENNLRPTIRSGGHCYEDYWANNTGGILIDTSSMNRIYFSLNESIVWAEAGVKIGEFYNVLYKEFGLTAPVGVCLDLAIGGHITGGGYGYLARKFGLSIDYVDQMEIVHVNEHKNVKLSLVGRDSKNEKDKNLFWALLGGGSQNFGVITKVGFRNLPKSPELVYQYDARFNLNQQVNKSKFFDIVDKYGKFFIANSGVDSPYCDLFTGLLIKRMQNGESYIALQVFLLGDKRNLVDEFLSNILANDTTLLNNFKCEQMSYYRFTQVNGVLNDNANIGYYQLRRSAYMVSAMPTHQLEALWHYMTDATYSYVVDGELQIRGYGCAVSRLLENATAYPHRRALIRMQYGTVWQKVEDSGAQWSWSRAFYQAMYGEKGPRPDSVMDGCFANYPDGELVDWQHLYFKGNYERLQQVKKEWDPLNIFHHRQSIELPK